MSIVNFAIPKTLEKRIEQTIKEQGFSSKAEFFRSIAINYITNLQKPILADLMIEEAEKERKSGKMKSYTNIKKLIADLNS